MQKAQQILSNIQQSLNEIAQGVQTTSACVAQLTAEINEINVSMAFKAPTAQDMVTLQIKNQELAQVKLHAAQFQSIESSLKSQLQPFAKVLNNAQNNLTTVIKRQTEEIESREAAGTKGVVVTHQTTIVPIQ